MAADLFISEGQGEVPVKGAAEAPPFVGLAGLSLKFFADASCAEDSVGGVDSELSDEAGRWIHTEGTAEAPLRTRSLQMRLDTWMPVDEREFEACFDNVFLRMR